MTPLILILALAGPIATPNPQLTPGAVRPLTRQQVCTTRWGLDARHVTTRMKQQVAARYGLRWPTTGYLYDHLVPRELGGADSVDNLWPQPTAEAKQIKDPQENALHRAVCTSPPSMSLAEAQARMRQWPAPLPRH